jgi:hypothetical protein
MIERRSRRVGLLDDIEETMRDLPPRRSVFWLRLF